MPLMAGGPADDAGAESGPAGEAIQLPLFFLSLFISPAVELNC